MKICQYITVMKWLKASLIVQIILALYFLAIVWFPLGSWNNQPGKRLIEAIHEGHAAAATGFTCVMLLPMLLFALAFWKRWLWLMWLGLVGYAAWLTLQVQSWWIPWIFGADERALNNEKFLEKTYKIFPSSSAHPAPDAMHFVLDLLLLACVVMTAIGLMKVWLSARSEVLTPKS